MMTMLNVMKVIFLISLGSLVLGYCSLFLVECFKRCVSEIRRLKDDDGSEDYINNGGLSK